MTKTSQFLDLNADLGEGYGPWRMGDDTAMLDVVTSANVACGFHAGDPDIMAETFARAKEKGVAIGAHVAFPDLAGFGRRAMAMTPREIERAVAYQIGAAQALAAYAGHRVTHVKAHGALANIAEREAAVADALARATRAVDPELTLLAIALSEQTQAGERAGLRVAHEIFADRAYVDDGRLQPRKEPGAVITDSGQAIARVREMLAEGALVTITGKRLPTPIDSVCVHGDTPHAVQMARRLRAELEAEGLVLRPFIEA
ncbi:LamB/YcsF family protein [Methylocystis sp. ATCC 49242]|uniref:LamB/YcsF family protein n=1 Tax=Methylocystis sp. ATCC 49242 TaxID=622637 RepID=UPI0001F88863|nr:5-oxoprolinase subunit PxpA [Methylocystis sp. ATCC 49242]